MDPKILKLLPALESFSLLEAGLLVVSVVLIIFSRFIVRKFWHLPPGSPHFKSRLSVFRAFNFLIVFVILLVHFVGYAENPGWAHKFFGVVMVIFSSFWSAQIIRYFVRRRYGRHREVNNENIVSETYNSRMLSLLATVFIIIVALIGIIQLLGFNSLLEAGGMIGIIGVMLALTQGSWAPDIISGLIILNSGLVEEGDVIEIEKDRLIAVVYKTKLFHTELLNLVNNHRIMLRNAMLRDMMLQNLSKFASARGLREVLRFKIGYDTPQKEIRECFQAAYERALLDQDIGVEESHGINIRVFDTGDDAVEWAFYYYTKDIKNLIKTRQLLSALVLEEANRRQISLATPALRQFISDKT